MLLQELNTLALPSDELTVTLADPFKAAATGVLEEILGDAFVLADTTRAMRLVLMEQCNVSVSITGAVRGTVIVGMSLATANRIASRMMDAQICTYDVLTTSAIAEAGDMIGSRARELLAESNGPCRTSPGVVIRGKGYQLSMLAVPAALTMIRTGVGDVRVTASREECLPFVRAATKAEPAYMACSR